MAVATGGVEKPENGWAGLKHLRHDILSGIVVSLVSLPLSSGIAIASGVPPIYGLMSAIIAGLVFPFIGGAYVTISGPAAGLAPVLMAAMVSLGGAGNAESVGAGYHHLLCVIFLVGCVQIVLSILKLARVAAVIPSTVVEGMLASIGLLIIVKQIPMFVGYTADKVHPHEFFEFVIDIPEFLHGLNPHVCLVSVTSIVLLFALTRFKVKGLSIIPPQLIVVVLGTIFGLVMGLGQLNPTFLITLPKEPFHAPRLPDFAGLWERADLWYAAGIAVVTLTLIDGVESLATAMAVDRIDPFRRKSQPNRVLFAMGVSNIASSLVGGLTIIPGGVKSKVNVAAGGRTLWANFTNAICLILYLLVAQGWINLIPKGVLAAVLIHTGWRMCEPAVWRHIARIGREQVFLFSLTVISTLLTDLLIGIIVGVAGKLLLNLILYRQSLNSLHGDEHHPAKWMRSLHDLFADPVERRQREGDVEHVYLTGPLVCFNSMRLAGVMNELDPEVKKVMIHLGPLVSLVDHTACENLLHIVHDFADSDIPVTLEGLDRLRRRSDYVSAMHVARAV